MRAVWPEATLTAGDFLRLVRERGAVYTAEELKRVDEASASDRPPEDKWPPA
jgi:hypothetical protein